MSFTSEELEFCRKLKEEATKIVITELVEPLRKEIYVLNRKVAKLEGQKDQWKYKANHYRDRLLDKDKKGISVNNNVSDDLIDPQNPTQPN